MAAIKDLLRRSGTLFAVAKMARKGRGVGPRRLTDLRATRDIARVVARTMLPLERLYDAVDCVRDVNRRGVPGDIVECGIWSGGCLGLMALTDERHDGERRYVGFDSFEGLPRPTPEDGRFHASYQAAGRTGAVGIGGAGVEEVRAFLLGLGAPRERLALVPGWFEDTVAMDTTIERIAVLRLDGDLYRSTRTCIEALHDRVSPGGHVIVDDYGDFPGCRRAIDEFREARGIDDDGDAALRWIDGGCVRWTKPA